MKVLVTGATGFIGTALCKELLSKGYQVNYLTMSADEIKHTNPDFQGFLWDPAKNEIDLNCLKNVDAIVNLAGHTINCKWTDQNKNRILQSRIDCSNTLYNSLQSTAHQVKYIINASAIGIYLSSENNIYTEENIHYGNDFLARVCEDWEQANKRFEQLGIKTAITRFGLVLAKNHGVLYELAKVVKTGMGASLGSGRQWMSWIHYKDVVHGIAYLLKLQMVGVFNFTAPYAIQQQDFLKLLATRLNKPLWLPNIPEFIIKLGLGERSALVLSSQHVKPEKLIENNYQFLFPNLATTLKDLYNN